MQGLASSAFARHYLRNHGCFLFLWVLRCFTSPRSLQLPYIFRQRLPDMTPVFQGFPIRKSTDQSSFTSSPWLIAGYNVLHRLLMPRHPPIALSSLSPQQKINYKDARVHYTILKQHDTPTPASQSQPTKGTQKHPNLKPGPRPKAWEPNSVHTPTNPPTTSPSTPTPPQQGSRQYQTRQQTQSARTRSMLPQQKTPPPCTTRHRQKCEWTTTKGRQKAP